MTRERLPNHRRAETIDFIHTGIDGEPRAYTATIGMYPDGRVGELFITGPKSGMADAQIRGGCVGISIALQHGATVERLARAMMHDGAGNPECVFGCILEMILPNDEPPLIDAPSIVPELLDEEEEVTA